MNKEIKIAVLDSVPRKYWADDEGITDAEKFIELLAPENTLADFSTYYVSEQQFPESVDDYDAFMLSGSPASVSDDSVWIQRLSKLIIEANQKSKRIIGTCFAHQLIAKTFGGEVSKNKKGWMIGNYNLRIRPETNYSWMEPKANDTGLYHFNEERVTRLPESAKAFAHSEEYPNFAFTLGDNIMCLQGHPEQPLRAMNNFIAATPLSEADLAKAKLRLDNGAPDAKIWAQWMMGFLLRA
ncbi:MAG: GMP synthase-like glutamine amidotransferase [Gammaproteobacteria bacterium]|jgi:GMP synthase-like glutamine amidotransferase